MQPKTIARIQFTLLALAVALLLWWTYPKPAEKPVDDLFAVSTTTVLAKTFPNVAIEAKSAYVYDAREGKALYAKNAEEERPLASLTKIMSALAASDVLPDYMLVRITPDDIREEGDSGLYPDENWNARKLIDYSLIVSSNDGIRAIASVAGAEISSTTATTTPPERLFVDRMNSLALTLGLKSMRFHNQSGLDISKSLSGGYGSAKDTVMLVDYILRNDPHLLEATSLEKTTLSSEEIPHIAENTNKSIPHIPSILASKTGYTDLSGGNVIVAWNAGLNHPIIISVLGSSYEGRFTDLDTLVNATLDYLSKTATSTVSGKK